MVAEYTVDNLKQYMETRLRKTEGRQLFESKFHTDCREVLDTLPFCTIQVAGFCFRLQ